MTICLLQSETSTDSCGGPSASKQWWTEEGTDKETVDKYISDIVAKINI